MNLPPNIVEIKPDVYRFSSSHPIVGPVEMAFLTDGVEMTERMRRRLCLHDNDEAWIQEMVVAYCRKTYMRPNRHPFDESLHVLEGWGDLFFFDTDGEITDVVELDAGWDKIIRIKSNTYHKLIIKSQVMILHELVPGPFRKGITTEAAPWSPSEDSPDIPAFHQRLEDYLNGE